MTNFTPTRKKMDAIPVRPFIISAIISTMLCNTSVQAELIELSSTNNYPIHQTNLYPLNQPLSPLLTENQQAFRSKSYYDFGQGKQSTKPSQSTNTPTIHTRTIDTQAVNFTDQYRNQSIAKWSLQHLNGSMKQVNDLWVQETLQRFTAELNAQVRQQALYAVTVIDSPSINAFAIPGGVIGINAGTVMSSESMDEVASVMSHEVAHISQRHYEHSKDNKTKSLLIQAAGMVAAVVAANASEGETATAILAGSSSMARDSAMAFSRDNERESDRIGMQIMSQAGYDVHAMSKFFATLDKHSQMNRNRHTFIPSYVRTHPMSAERMSEAKSRANQYPKVSLKQRKQHQQTFDLLKWRLKVLTNSTNEANLTSAAKSSLGAKFALVHWYGDNQRWQEATDLLDELASTIDHANNSSNFELQQLLAISQAKIASNRGNHQQAVDILTAQQKVYPERRDLRLYLAYELIDTNNNDNAQKALAILQPMTVSNKNGNNEKSHDRQVWQGMQLANEVIARTSMDSKLKQIATINALRYRAYDEMWNANYSKALVSLTQAKTEAKNNKTIANGTFDALLAMIEQEIEMVKEAKNFKV